MDYISGPCIAYALLTFALLLRPQPIWILLAGITWAAAVFTYPMWLSFTPACVFIYLAAPQTVDADPRRPPRVAAGALTLTAALAVVHHQIFGDGFNFLKVTIGMSRTLAAMRESPWANKNFSVTYADWLVFPGVAAALAVWLLITGRTVDRLLSLSYLYVVVVMSILTILPGRILEFDYIANFLVPGSFIVLGVGFFRCCRIAGKPHPSGY